MNLTQNITKESDPVRQKHYTTKKHWLVDFINIFWFILILFLFRQQIPYSADIIHIDLRIRTFHPVSVSAFLSGITEKSLNIFYYVCFYNIGYGCSCNAVKWLKWRKILALHFKDIRRLIKLGNLFEQ